MKIDFNNLTKQQVFWFLVSTLIFGLVSYPLIYHPDYDVVTNLALILICLILACFAVGWTRRLEKRIARIRRNIDKLIADEALRKCPLFESLPLEEQLQIREDELRERRRQALIDHPPGSIEKSRADIARIDWNERQVAELRQKIAERDRSSRQSQENTSATA